MADEKHLKNLKGKWHMNRELSSDVSPVLEIQGFNAVMRKAVSYAPVNLDISQPSDTEIRIKQSTTANIPAIDEEWYPGDHEWQEQSDKLLGKVRSRCRWADISDLQDMDDFLVKDVSGEVIQADVESLDRSWHAAQVWFFKDKRFVRRVLTTGEGNKRAETLLVYDFEG